MVTTKALRSNLAFISILPIYQEHKSSGGGLQPLNPDLNSADVSPSVSDFIADVEIAARNSLNPIELAYFLHFYASGRVVVEEVENPADDNNLQAHFERQTVLAHAGIVELDAVVRSKLGERLIDAGIFPLDKYMTPINPKARVG